MRIRKVQWIFAVLLISTALAACGGSPANPEQEDGSEGLPPVAVVKAREVLAAELNVGVEQVAIQSYARQDWTDSCLGLGGPAESCLAAIYPGWQVMLLVDGGESYEVRTDELGEIIRIKQ